MFAVCFSFFLSRVTNVLVKLAIIDGLSLVRMRNLHLITSLLKYGGQVFHNNLG